MKKRETKSVFYDFFFQNLFVFFSFNSFYFFGATVVRWPFELYFYFVLSFVPGEAEGKQVFNVKVISHHDILNFFCLLRFIHQGHDTSKKMFGT